MEEKYTREEMIELYLQDRLSLEEKTGFEQKLLEDASFSQELDLMRSIITGIQMKKDIEVWTELEQIPTENKLKQIVSEAEKKYNKRKELKLTTKKRSLFISVFSSIAFILLLFFIGIQPEYSSQKLYQQYHNLKDIEWIPNRGGILLNPDRQSHLNKALLLYQQQNYAEALAMINETINGLGQYNIPDQVVFFSAVCLSETNKDKESIEKLEYLSLKDDSEYKQEAQWQLALAYLKDEKRDESRKTLLKIVNAKGFYADRANELLDKLEQKRWF
ncbi:MAG: hypothetical protein LBL90_08380 [Prevotellaceae bacterium]|jgi:hypothetical protein|nr:hypothetical protein [Prevotellaceae bacterium]